MFIGATSHWVTLVIHKRQIDNKNRFYLLDSSNINYLNCKEDQIPKLYDEELHEKVATGLPKKGID